MALTPVKSAGTLLTWNSSGLLGFKSFKFGGSRSTPDLTTLADTYYRRGSGLPDYGTCDLEGFYDQADTIQLAVLADLRAGTKRTAIVTLSNGKTYTFTSYARSMKFGAPQNEGVPLSLSLRICSAVT